MLFNSSLLFFNSSTSGEDLELARIPPRPRDLNRSLWETANLFVFERSTRRFAEQWLRLLSQGEFSSQDVQCKRQRLVQEGWIDGPVTCPAEGRPNARYALSSHSKFY